VSSAVAGATSAARVASAAGDLKRHHGSVATRKGRHSVPDGDHFNNPFVPEGVRPLEWIAAGQNGNVQIACGNRHRTHKCCIWTWRDWVVDLLPMDLGGTVEYESLHGILPGVVIGRVSYYDVRPVNS